MASPFHSMVAEELVHMYEVFDWKQIGPVLSLGTLAMAVLFLVMAFASLAARDRRAAKGFLAFALMGAGIWAWLQPELKAFGIIVTVAATLAVAYLWFRGISEKRAGHWLRKDERTTHGH